MYCKTIIDLIKKYFFHVFIDDLKAIFSYDRKDYQHI